VKIPSEIYSFKLGSALIARMKKHLSSPETTFCRLEISKDGACNAGGGIENDILVSPIPGIHYEIF
jgi:hypothetical protein